MVAIMCVAGLYVPYFDLVCSLIGSFSNGIIAFILPVRRRRWLVAES